MKYPLMQCNVQREDLDAVIEHLKQDDPLLTNGPKCREFEMAWSKWLGVKYSVFVNSGASANLLSMTALKIKHPEGGEVIVPPLTWVSDIASVIQCGFTPVFADINPDTLAMDTDKILKSITNKTRAVFLTHILGFDGLTDDLLQQLKDQNIPLIEDVCESHGATHQGKKLGSLGWMSNFSFYYAHHMTTIEGGMICTNDEQTYEIIRMLRSHGMVRESTSAEIKENYKKDYPNVHPEFTFFYPAYNLRNTEIGGILGLSQLPKLDNNVIRRNENHHRFLSQLDSTRFKTDFKLEGSSNYAINIILKEKDPELFKRLTACMIDAGIEFRRGTAGGGNQLRQPYLKGIVPNDHYLNFPNTEHVHLYGLYIGNFPNMLFDEVDEICKVVNGV
jgi:CDP-6-deoxy-D-xylo-4-hexulose-3-dehydrase